MAEPISETIRNAVTKYALGRRCIQGWLGYGEALFLGLSDEGLPEGTADGLRRGCSRERIAAALRESLREGRDPEHLRRLLRLQRQELGAPSAEIQTHFADWVLTRDEVVGSSCDERTIAQEAIQQLLGRCVSSILMSTDALDLTVSFDGGYELRISAFRQFEGACTPAPDAWMLRTDNSIYYGVRCDGTVFIVPETASCDE